MTTRQNHFQIVTLTCVLLALPLTATWAAQDTQATPAQPPSIEQVVNQQLPALLASLDGLEKAIQMGHTEHALTELKKARQLATVLQQVLAQHVKPAIANAVCPIMGGKIDPAKVPANLIRDFQGQKVAFCCAMCPPQWDKLTDAQKAAKLAQAQAKAAAQMRHEHAEHGSGPTR